MLHIGAMSLAPCDMLADSQFLRLFA